MLVLQRACWLKERLKLEKPNWLIKIQARDHKNLKENCGNKKERIDILDVLVAQQLRLGV